MRGAGIASVFMCLVVAGCAGSTPVASVSARPTPTPAYYRSCVAATASGAQAPGVSYSTMVVDRTLRDYRVFQPPSLDTSKPFPLVLIFHGAPIDAAGFEDVIKFDAEAATAGVLAVSPDGCDEDWDQAEGSSDVRFVSALIDRLESQFAIDPSRIYVVGASAGGFMAYRLACDLAGRLRAVASDAGSMWWDCTPSRPVPIYEIHGTADENVPYQGGASTYRNNRVVEAAPTVVARWVRVDGCTGAPATSHVGITNTQRWSHCAGGAVVQFDTVVGGHHTWFGSTYDPVPGEPDANALIWKFFTSLPAT